MSAWTGFWQAHFISISEIGYRTGYMEAPRQEGKLVPYTTELTSRERKYLVWEAVIGLSLPRFSCIASSSSESDLEILISSTSVHHQYTNLS